MNSSNYDFKKFQAELAALDSKAAPKPEQKPDPVPPSKPLSKKQLEAQRMANAREEFLALCKKYELAIADVVTFFPAEEGIAYLEQLIIANQAKPKRGRKPKTVE
jgi:hypothetical protein